MNESQKIIFVASHAGDNVMDLNRGSGELFITMLIALGIIFAIFFLARFFIEFLGSFLMESDEEDF